MPRVDFDKLTAVQRGELSENVRERVEKARAIQAKRFQDSDFHCNADMGPSEVRDLCQLDDTGKKLMRSALAQMNLSARAFHRILKVARTIADLTGDESIQPAYFAEGLQYRPRQS